MFPYTLEANRFLYVQIMYKGLLKEVANALLFVVMCGAAYTHNAQKDDPKKMIPAFVFASLLAIRFVVRYLFSSPPKSSESTRPEEKSLADARKSAQKDDATKSAQERTSKVKKREKAH